MVDLFGQLQWVSYFSKVDLRFGFCSHVWKKVGDIPKCPFEIGMIILNIGGVVWLAYASVVFMGLLNRVLKPYLDMFVVVSSDDVLICLDLVNHLAVVL